MKTDFLFGRIGRREQEEPQFLIDVAQGAVVGQQNLVEFARRLKMIALAA